MKLTSLLLFLLANAVITSKACALDCPAPPVQVNNDWGIQVQAEVGKIGPVKGAELETRVRTATVDLLGKLPSADRVYLEQMMFAAYCSALHGDKTLSEFAKANQILAYRRELQKNLTNTVAPGKVMPLTHR